MHRIVQFSFLLLIVTQCNYKNYVPDGELLYDGAEIEVLDGKHNKDKGEIVSASKKLLRPKPNKKILGARF
jgi:outer membrane protein insertion porin family